MAIVMNHSTLTGTARLVLLGIANHMGDTGAWPKIETLARYAACSERTVQRCIAQAVEAGELAVYHQDGGTHKTRNDLRPNRYVVLVTCPDDCDHSMNHRSSRLRHDIDDNGVTPTSPGDSNGATPVSPRNGNGVTSTAERGDNGVTPRTVIEPSKELLSTADAADECEIGDSVRTKPAQADPEWWFALFWDAWPGRKAQRLRALDAFNGATLAGTDPTTIVNATIRLAADPNLPDKQMIPLPAKWLDAHGWEDEPYPPRTAAPPPQPATPTPPRFDRATLTNPAAAPPPANFRALAGIA